MMHKSLLLWVGWAALLGNGTAGRAEEVVPPPGARLVQPASGEAEAAIKQFRVPPGFKVELFAAEPRVANISSFDIDPSGKVYVVEVFRRRGGGVLDLRTLSHDWLEDDLSSRTVADRIALVKRRVAPPDLRLMQIESDRVRLVEDRDGDGRADHDSIFATGFNQLEDGTAAGVLSFNGNVYFANIPNLWLLRDANGDGVADTRKALHTGFGVHYEISGHDLHGLRLGPDGRIYFSIGDRSLNVTTPEGRQIANPDSGAVLRCEPDGSNLELVHTGLRNPQDLAFDEYGNLFTGDNNSDGGDLTRWVYVVEGGDSGWRVGYQWHEFPVSRGPWNNERLWEVNPPVPAEYRLPPIADLKDVPGPAGLTYTGTAGMPPEWRNKFLLVDFRGGPSNSGIWALTNRPSGAEFDLVETKKFIDHVLPTDVEVGYDGGVYFSDWINGWVPVGKGRIYRVINPESAKDASVADAHALLNSDLTRRSEKELLHLLSHRDMRVRTAAQFALVKTRAVEGLSLAVSHGGPGDLIRVHAVWALGQMARDPKNPDSAAAAGRLAALLDSQDYTHEEVRAQIAKVLGEARYTPAFKGLRAALKEGFRVGFFAAIALGRLGNPDAVPALFDMLRSDVGGDPYVRHAGVVALARIGDIPALVSAMKDASPSVRLAALLALRRLGRPEVAELLKDPTAQIILEAARAINDGPIDAATPRLAAILGAEMPGPSVTRLNEMVQMRAMNANFRLGTPESARALAAFATRPDAPDFLRVEALKMLGDWGKPSRLDRVTGVYHPRDPGDAKAAAAAAREVLPRLLRDSPDSVRTEAARLVPVVGLTDESVLVDVVNGKEFSAESRAAALAALASTSRKPPLLAGVVNALMSERDPVLRRQVILVGATLPDGADRVGQALNAGSPRDQQAAFEAVAALKPVDAETALTDSLERLLAGKVPPEARLDLLDAAAKSASPKVAEKLKQYESLRAPGDPLAPFRETLAGGDAERGRKIFTDRADVQCLRCHSIKGEGGSAGPDLSGVGKRQTREYVLESVLFPAKQIAKGWETVTLRLGNGDTVAGVLKKEDGRQIVLTDPEKGDVTIEQAKVTARRGGQTAMPEDVARPLSKHDLRDLVEFLAGLK